MPKKIQKQLLFYFLAVSNILVFIPVKSFADILSYTFSLPSQDTSPYKYTGQESEMKTNLHKHCQEEAIRLGFESSDVQVLVSDGAINEGPARISTAVESVCTIVKGALACGAAPIVLIVGPHLTLNQGAAYSLSAGVASYFLYSGYKNLKKLGKLVFSPNKYFTIDTKNVGCVVNFDEDSADADRSAYLKKKESKATENWDTKTHHFTDHEIKSFLYEFDLPIDELWMDQITTLSNKDLQDLTRRTEVHTEAPLSSTVEQRLAKIHEKVIDKIRLLLTDQLPSRLTDSKNDFARFLVRADPSKADREILAQQLASYFDPHSFQQRSLAKDEYLLDSPSMPLKIGKDEQGHFTSEVLSKVSQSSSKFKAFETDPSPDAPNKTRYEPSDVVQKDEYLGKIFSYLTAFLFLKYQLSTAFPKPPSLENAPRCYYGDKSPNNATACTDSLSVYICEGHTFIGLQRSGERGEKTAEVKGFSPIDKWSSSDGHVRDETYYTRTMEIMDSCPKVTYPLDPIQSLKVVEFIKKTEKQATEGEYKYSLGGNNCIDFSQAVFASTGYPGHFLDNMDPKKPINILMSRPGQDAGANLLAFFHQRGFLGTVLKILDEVKTGVLAK